MPLADIIKKHLSLLSPRPSAIAKTGTLRAPIEAVLFDIYGTLLISASGEIGGPGDSADIQPELVELLRRFDIQTRPSDLTRNLTAAILAEHRQMQAQGIDYPEVVIETIWQSLLKWQDLERIKTLALEYELVLNPVWPMPHLQAVLSRFRAQGIPMGIISNAQFYTPIIIETVADAPLDRLGFKSDLIVFSYQHQRAKPSADLFDTAVGQLAKRGIAPRNVLFVGNDMRNDILPAGKVGFQTALFGGDARSLRLRADDPLCRGVTADVVITNLLQLLSIDRT